MLLKVVDGIFKQSDILRKNIFGEENVKFALNDMKKIVLRSNSLFSLSVGYFYARYRNWREERRSEIVDISDIHDYYKFLPNSTLRILYVMDEMYYKYSLNHDIISYLLVNTQINISQRTTQDSSLDDVLKIPTDLAIVSERDNAFVSVFCSEYTKLARNVRYLPKEVTRDSFASLLRHFAFYKYVGIDVEEDGNVFFLIYDDITGDLLERISSHHTVICEGDTLYLLTDIQRLNNVSTDDSLRVAYKSILDGTTLLYTVSGDGEESRFKMTGTEFFIDVTGRIIPEKYSPELFFRGLNTGSYKYVNRLGMALVDSVYGKPEGLINTVKLIKAHWDELNLEELDPDLSYKIGVTKKGDIIESIKNLNNSDFSVNEIKWRTSKKWDDIIVRLLIIKSPREVISSFIEKCDIFDTFLAEIGLRFDHRVNADAIVEGKNKEMSVAKRELIILNFGQMGIDEAQITKWVNKTDALVASKLVVHALSELTNKDSDYAPLDVKESVGGSIYPRTLLLDDLNRRLNSGEEIDPKYIIKRADFILRQSLKTVICTFKALIASLDEWSDFEMISYSGELTSDQVQTRQAEIQKAFLTELGATARLFFTKKSEELIAELVHICNDCFDTEKSLVKELGTKYYIMTGRTMPLDTKSLFDVVKIDEDNNVYVQNPDNENELWRLDVLRDECQKNDPMSKKYSKAYLNAAYRIMRVLGGHPSDIDTFNDLTQKSAYPFVGTYVDNRRNMDGHRICNFSIRNSIGEVTRIHILSDMEYKLNKKYYVIPNLQRTDREWWIQPFMIECEDFNDIITAGLNEEEKKAATTDETKSSETV